MSQVSVNVRLSAILTDNTGTPLQGATIQFAYKLSSAATFTPGGSAVTDSTGTAAVTLSLTAPNMYDFTAAFAGTTAFAASNVQVTFDTTAQLAQTQLTVQVTPASASSASASGNLSSLGIPVAGAVVSVSVDGTAAGNATTDTAGNFAFVITNLSPGNHTVKVIFAGSTIYAPSQASSSFSFPGPNRGPIIVAAAIVGLAVTTVFAVVTRRKR